MTILDTPITNEFLTDSLKRYFGYNEFRKYQEDIISTILNKKDLLAILPTGAGKSICYQLPALLMQGTAFVISPLISLMQDQVVTLTKQDIPAAYLSSGLHFRDVIDVLENLDIYKLIYLSPERFADPLFQERLKKISISFFAIDEAHCISQWGHSFRPEYRQLSIIKTLFPNCPIVALTATATPEVEHDIATQLAMKSPSLIRGSFDRPNLTLRIIKRENEISQLTNFLDRHSKESGIIYCSTRRGVEDTYQNLVQLGYQVKMYHAGMSDADRTESQQAFIEDQIPLMVATVAFGMGVHKPNIRYIVHMNMPKSIEQYYQEIGRAGRDGLPSECLLLFGGQDLMVYRSFLPQIEDELVRKETRNKTEKMYQYCTACKCRRKSLLSYFGEIYPHDKCNSCDNCLDGVEQFDGTEIAQKVLSCVYKLRQNFGIKQVIDVLRGSKSESIISRGHDQLSTYGIMSDCSANGLRFYIDSLLEQNILKSEGDEYPTLKFTDNAWGIIHGTQKITFTKKSEEFKPSDSRKSVSKNKEKDSYYELKNNPLYHELAQLRQKYARDEKVPPYIVFSDRTLLEMVNKPPKTENEFLSINGVGPVKWQKYGVPFLNAILKHTSFETSAPTYSFSQPKATQKTQQSTSDETLKLFREGKSLDDIAYIRRKARGTIVEHIAEKIKQGEFIDITHLVTEEDQQKIKEAIAKVGMQKLTPIKNELPDEITYDQIRLVCAIESVKK